MKVGLITTTINIPTVLSLYRRLDPDVRFFVAMDKKTPAEAYDFVSTMDNSVCIGDDSRWACSDLIGWNTISRRNIALLEALEWGADTIVSIDDDNIPLTPDYFERFDDLLYTFGGYGKGFKAPTTFNGIKLSNTWFDPASLAFPRVVQRGFPQHSAFAGARNMFMPVTDAKIGVAQGMILGDPDTSAVDRISQHPEVHQVSELLRAGIVTDPRECYAPLNSQNIAFARALAPCFLMVPAYRRYDDIYAGLVVQRIMREHNYCVHFGQPFVWQQRNAHNLLHDLAAEQWGAEHILEFASWLDAFLGQTDVIGFLRVMATNLPKFISPGTQELWLAWLSDCEAVMHG
jgi:reversibly glycosylated polypeptide